MTSKIRMNETCRTDVKSPSCRRGETRGALRVARFAVVAVMAMVFGLAGLVQSADAANYHTDTGSGTYGGLAVNFTCADPGAGAVGVLVPTATFPGTWACADVTDNYTVGAGTTLMTFVNTTAFPSDMELSDLSLWAYIRNNDGDATDQVRYEVGYVTGGAFTALGGQTQTGPADRATIAYSVPGVIGTAPNGSFLAIRAISVTATNGDRIYMGTADDANGSVRFSVTETPVSSCAATTPNNLNGSAASPTQVDLTWTYDGTNNDYYNVYRDGVQIATNVTTGSYSDTTAAASTTYDYTVRGYKGAPDNCESADSNTFNVTTPACVPSGTLSVTAGQTLNGNPINVTSITTANNASGLEYRVFTGGSTTGPSVDVLEQFTGTGTGRNAGWDQGVWVTNNNNVPATANGDLQTGTATTSTGTGPQDTLDAYVGTATDSFLYTEQSTQSGDRWFKHINPFNASETELSVSFYYNMYGTNIGTLSLQVSTDDTNWTTEWTISGQQNATGAWDETNQVVIDLWNGGGDSTTQYRSGNIYVRWVLGAGTGFRGDIAIDELRIFGPGATITSEVDVYNSVTDNPPELPTAVSTTGWANSGVLGAYNLEITGNDATCGTPLTAATETFTWTSCVEGNTLFLTPITDPITGDVTVTATGTAPNKKVGIVPTPTNNSGWVYSPAPDDNTTVVSFYAIGDSTCAGAGGLSASQLNVATNTMFPPTIDAFVIPANVTDTAAPLEVPITTFTATDNSGAAGIQYLITESSTAPGAGDAGWGAKPTSYTVGAYGSYTLYAWTKDAAGNVSLSANDSVTMSNCVEAGSVTVAISTDPGASPAFIPGSVTVTANLNGGATNGSVRWRNNGGSWSAWVPSGATYTPPGSSAGTVDFEAKADGTCAGNEVFSATLNRDFDSRLLALEPTNTAAVQNGLTGIRATFIYCNDRNGSGTFRVEWKLASAGSYLPADVIVAADGGANDSDGTYNENVVVLISGLTTGETYDVRMTFIDGTDGLNIGTQPAVSTKVVVLVPWTDNDMLHNANRFACDVAGFATQALCEGAGNVWTIDRKWATGWGTTAGEYGPISCATCHDKNTGNIKRVVSTVTASQGSFPGSAIVLNTVEDSSSDFGNDAGGHATSDRVCEVCHTKTNYHRYDTSAQTGGTAHYNQADCIKCHQHKDGFRANCTSCHANPPIDASGLVLNGTTPADATGSATAGKHDLHANTLGYDCNTCHTGWTGAGEMPKGGDLNLGFNIVLGSTTDTTGTYDGRGAGSYTTAVGTTNSGGGGLTCSAIYCHGTATPAWTDAGTAACGSCHGDATGAPTTAAGDGDLSGATSGKKVGKHPQHIEKGYACTLCHNGAGDGTAKHIDGANDISFSGAAVGTTYSFVNSQCSNVACHSGTYDWDTAAAPLACDSCHGYPPTSAADAANNKHVSPTPVNHDKFGDTLAITGSHSECNVCHGFSNTNGMTDNSGSGGDAYLASYHQDGNIEMNGITAPDDGQSTDYRESGVGAYGCNSACHSPSNDANHQLSDSGLPVQFGEYGGGDCDGCHDGSGAAGTPQWINNTRSHTLVDTGLTCAECHGGHGAGTIQVPNNATVGINYGTGGIDLGAAGTADGATEAEICWNCHGAAVSEWGTNNNADGLTYNYGTLNQSNWVGATWSSADQTNFSYKNGAIKSTHSANTAGTSVVSGTAYSVGGMSESLDAVGDIRCSYCHDVHDLNKLASDNSTGKPYLRGTWKGNPYKEDGAPRSGMTGWDMTGTLGTSGNAALGYGRVPRASVAPTNNGGVGGYWIDQNSGNPNNGETLVSTAGLCTLCHGSNVDTMDVAAGQGNGGNEGLWIGTNGHSNAVIGGTGSAKANIFNTAARGGPAESAADGTAMDMGAFSEADRGLSYRGNTSFGWGYTPVITWDTGDSNRAYAYEAFEWGDPAAAPGSQSNATFTKTPIATGTVKLTDPTATSAATAQTQYHTFNCGKCHNPHASRLPKLMITNCLDTNHNTWQDDHDTDADSGSTNGEKAANWMTSQNCHRRGPAEAAGEGGSGTAWGAGWNKVTPW